MIEYETLRSILNWILVGALGGMLFLVTVFFIAYVIDVLRGNRE